jgi:hypothetical protein
MGCIHPPHISANASRHFTPVAVSKRHAARNPAFRLRGTGADRDTRVADGPWLATIDGMASDEECKHLEEAARRTKSVHPSARGCTECLQQGGEWVHLRLCLACGHVGCCDDSPNRHATRHFHATRHPVIKSFEPGEDWAWCYDHEVMVDEIPSFREESPTRHIAPPAHP